MKTLCAALVLLSLVSVCQPASLACEKLVKPLDRDPDMTGRWYFIAMSSEVCLVSAFVNALLWPSVSMDVISKDTPNHYSEVTYGKMHGVCFNANTSFVYANSSLVEVNSDNTPAEDPDAMLQTSCPDCVVVKEEMNTLLLLSKRPAVTATELKEFEMQAECLGWSKPEILNTDHDYRSCASLEDIDEDEIIQVLQSFFQKMLERVTNTYHIISKCVNVWQMVSF
ncbi:uncharacterized protein LOC115780895 [Archocentrus centrarchus]|uniref:uncharacterized protein LOC115780895 n=1 Tax=Archocentrus centrarchus TaxID=63155 RepID=UPI0011E9C93A|nr:uncharacterized protein LOC115780895 [Archocentrus centrarchus]